MFAFQSGILDFPSRRHSPFNMMTMELWPVGLTLALDDGVDVDVGVGRRCLSLRPGSRRWRPLYRPHGQFESPKFQIPNSSRITIVIPHHSISKSSSNVHRFRANSSTVPGFAFVLDLDSDLDSAFGFLQY